MLSKLSAESVSVVSFVVFSIVASVLRTLMTPAFEKRNPKTGKAIKVLAKATSDLLGAYLEAKKPKVPTAATEPTIIVTPEDSK